MTPHRRSAPLRVPALLAALLAAGPVAAGAAPTAQDGEGAPAERPLGRFEREVRELASPADLAYAPDGTLWVLEADRHRAVALGSDGAPRAALGAPGEGTAGLLFPRGLAVAADGSVWIADTGHDRVLAFDADGAHLVTFGARGAGAGELNAPCGIDTWTGAGPDGAPLALVAVADRGNDRVQVFDRAGRVRLAVGAPPPGEEEGAEPGAAWRAGRLRRPLDVAFGPDGTLYVADGDHDRVQRFAADGAFLDAWGGFGGYEGQLDGPSGLAVDATGVHVVDRGNHRVQLFDHEGRWISAWGVHALLPRAGAGKLHYPERIALAPDGGACAIAETFEDRVQLFSRFPPGETPPVPLLGPKEGGSTHYGRALDAAGDLYAITAPETHGLLVLDSTPARAPVLVTTCGGHGAGWGRFVRPGGVDVALDRVEGTDGARERWSVVVADRGNRRLQELRLAHATSDPLGYRPEMARFARGLDLAALGRDFAGVTLEWTPEPGALRRDAEGVLWVCDPRNDRLLAFGPDLAPRAALGGHGTAPGKLRGPRDVAVGPDGALWVVDAHNFRVQALERDGRPRLAVGRRGTGPGEFLAPSGLWVEADGTVLVSDARRHDVQELGPDGAHRRTFGGAGLGAGELFRPAGLVRDGEGRLVLLDHGNHRAQRFGLTGLFLDAFGARWFVEPTRR